MSLPSKPVTKTGGEAGDEHGYRGKNMIGLPKRRGLLVIALIGVLAATAGMAGSVTGHAAAELAAGEHIAYMEGYPDGCMRPLERITREETAVVFFRLLSMEIGNPSWMGACPFIDLDRNRWSRNEIAALYQAGIVQGDPDGRFRPSAPITRAEFAVMAARYTGIAESKEASFPDVENHWSSEYIQTALERGWIRGYGDGSFRPDGTIIRCEAMMLVNEALDRRVDTGGLHEHARQWPDNTKDKWYYEIVLEAANSHEYQRADKPRSTERWTVIRENPVW